MVRRLLQITLAVTTAVGLFMLGRETDAAFVMICAVALSLGTPKKYGWFALATWGSYFLLWSGYELIQLIKGDQKFGWMLIPYSVGGIVFWIASWLTSRSVVRESAYKTLSG